MWSVRASSQLDCGCRLLVSIPRSSHRRLSSVVKLCGTYVAGIILFRMPCNNRGSFHVSFIGLPNSHITFPHRGSASMSMRFSFGVDSVCPELVFGSGVPGGPSPGKPKVLSKSESEFVPQSFRAICVTTWLSASRMVVQVVVSAPNSRCSCAH